jgi:maltose O-acetyltransferase
MTEWEKMVAGSLYDPNDPDLVERRHRARSLLQRYNASLDPIARENLARVLLGETGADVWIEPPFYCDYGTNITLGAKVYMNFDCVILDVAPVSIGEWTMLGPAVQIYAATHPVSAEERRKGLELGRPVRIGRDVWIGGGTVINPGVSIGDGAVIGSGSVVTRDIPANVVAAGNPCRVIRAI